MRAHGLLDLSGQTGLIATNTLAQGDTREVGLDQLVADGVVLRRSIKSKPWPSANAVLEYCAVWTSRLEPSGTAARSADGAIVTKIAPSLDPASRVSGTPWRLASGGDVSFIGSYVLGMGFTMEPKEAAALIDEDPRNRDVLFPYLNGQDVNARPDCSASRWVINFQDWSLDRAKTYPECYGRVTRLVKPERAKNKDRRRREYWWRFTRPTPELYEAVAELERVIVITLHTKMLTPARVISAQVFSHGLAVFASDDSAMLAFLSSAPHYWWATSRGSTLGTGVRYTPSDVFETLPLPELTPDMRELGDGLDTYRREIMLSRQLGLTKTYNLVHNPACTDSEVEELRRIHRNIDTATVKAYGWDDLLDQLDHGYHPVARETRYTIGPVVKQEILDRLLELNHERYAEEVAAGLHDKKGRRGKKTTADEGTLF